MVGIVAQVDPIENYAIVTDSEGMQYLIDAILSAVEAGQAIEFNSDADSTEVRTATVVKVL